MIVVQAQGNEHRAALQLEHGAAGVATLLRAGLVPACLTSGTAFISHNTDVDVLKCVFLANNHPGTRNLTDARPDVQMHDVRCTTS